MLFGYGIKVRMQDGHLEIEDGIGPERRKLRLARVGHRLKRLVLIGSDGFVTLEALRWLADQDVAFTMLHRDGKILFITGPVRSSDARLRRAQALAGKSEIGIEIARELIDKKLAGQEQVARRKLLSDANADTISRYRAELRDAVTLDRIRLIESHAAAAYWSIWSNLPISFPKKDEPRVPDHWRVFGARVSPLTGSPRLAANPPNAMLNYLYALLESEARLAAAALGLDPGLGMLHVDTKARDSLACDLMEAVRPQIDAYLLDWITRQPLKRQWFFEQRDGNCRLMADLVTKLSETAAIWGRAVAPYAEWAAQVLWDSTRKPASEQQLLPTRLTQQRRTEGRGRKFLLAAIPRPQIQRVCPGCGAGTKRGRHCLKCGKEISGEKLIELAKTGRIVTLGADAQRKRSETQKRHEAAKREWRNSSRANSLDRQTYDKAIQPCLASVTIANIASTLGVSEPYAADIRSGRRRPHPRHWQALVDLVGIID